MSEPWLAATPDGIVRDPDGSSGLIEIKNPHSVRDLTLIESVKKHSTFCLSLNDDTKNLSLKLRHDYYHQIQTQRYTALESNGAILL